MVMKMPKRNSEQPSDFISQETMEKALDKVSSMVKAIAKKLNISEKEYENQLADFFSMFDVSGFEKILDILERDYGYERRSDEFYHSAKYYDRVRSEFLENFTDRERMYITSQVFNVFMEEHADKLGALAVFQKRLEVAMMNYALSSERDESALKEGVQKAADMLISHYSSVKIEPTILDYIRAVAFAFVGVIVGILTLPGVIFSSNYRSQLQQTFFSFPQTLTGETLIQGEIENSRFAAELTM